MILTCSYKFSRQRMFLHSEPSLIEQFLGGLFLTNEKYTKGLVFGGPNVLISDLWFVPKFYLLEAITGNTNLLHICKGDSIKGRNFISSVLQKSPSGCQKENI